MTPRFTSKEIHFLKTDSDELTIHPPEVYFSDLLLTDSPGIRAFEKRLEQASIPNEKFLCAVVQISQEDPDPAGETAKDAFEAAFSLFLDHDRGIWETLDETSFILAFWDYEDEKKASKIILSLKNALSKGVRAQVLVGSASFPYHDFPRAKAVANALKAIDHAAFFGSGALVPFDGTSLNISGDRLYHLTEYALAVKEYEEGLRIKPHDINLINSLGVCFAVSGELDKAMEQFEAAMKINPDEIMVVYNIGLLHQIDNDTDKAVAYLRKAHAVNGAVFEVELVLGHLLFKKDLFHQALPHLEAATRINPKSSLAFRIKGEIFLARDEPEKAGPEFNTAIKLNPSDAFSLSGYAKSLELQNKNLNIALTFAKSSMALDPDNPLFGERLRTLREKIEGIPAEENISKTA
nr:tetratricopeptide repeat protein [Desulfobacula sp.]